jgi:hypothetical protein
MERVVEVEVVQFLRPNGRKRHCRVVLPESVQQGYDLVRKNGCRLTAEELENRLISLTIEEPKLGDFSAVIVENGPKVPESLVEMLVKFNEQAFEKWKNAAERTA